MKKFLFCLLALFVATAVSADGKLMGASVLMEAVPILAMPPTVVEVVSDPDDLSDFDEWQGTNAGFVFSAQNQLSTFDALYANCQVDKTVDWTDYGFSPDYTTVEFEYRALPAFVDDGAVTLTMTYTTGFSSPPANTQLVMNLDPGEGDWQTVTVSVNAPSFHRIHVLMFSLSSFDYPYGDVFEIRDVSWKGKRRP